MSGRPGRSGGHNRKSRAAHVLRGSFKKTRHDRLGVAVPSPPGAVVKPRTLSPGASTVWDVLAPLAIAMQTLSAADVMAFTTLCELQATLAAVVRLKDTKRFDLRQERQTSAALRPFYAMFALDPFSRSRLAVAPSPPARPISKWAEAFKAP